jgi:hypothetical protein
MLKLRANNQAFKVALTHLLDKRIERTGARAFKSVLVTVRDRPSCRSSVSGESDAEEGYFFVPWFSERCKSELGCRNRSRFALIVANICRPVNPHHHKSTMFG